MATKRKKKVTVASCPRCGTGYTYEAVKSLWGKATRATQLSDAAVTVQVDCCGAKLTMDEVKTMWGKATSSRRQHFGAGPGRPKLAERCPCGAMTKTRAKARGHKCEPPKT
jgi:hypothetical protein